MTETIRDERGYSLIEMLVVMVILGIVLSGLTTVFVSGSNAELSMNRRFQSQEQARVALDTIRRDVHCASAAQASAVNTYDALRLDVSSCYATADPPTPYVYWCVVPVTTSPPRYQLYRSGPGSASTTSTCTSSDTSRRLVADDLVTHSTVFSTSTANYGLETAGVDFAVSVDPTVSENTYVLSDSIVVRNSSRCPSTGTCPTVTVP